MMYLIYPIVVEESGFCSLMSRERQVLHTPESSPKRQP